MLRRLAPALARLRPALGRALPPALAASIASTAFSSFSVPALCMYPPLEPDELVDQVEDSVDERLEEVREELRGSSPDAWYHYRNTGEW
jgi:hypothetical protein